MTRITNYSNMYGHCPPQNFQHSASYQCVFYPTLRAIAHFNIFYIEMGSKNTNGRDKAIFQHHTRTLTLPFPLSPYHFPSLTHSYYSRFKQCRWRRRRRWGRRTWCVSARGGHSRRPRISPSRACRRHRLARCGSPRRSRGRPASAPRR